MADILDLTLDTSKMRDGVWFDHPLGGDDGRVRLRARGCRQAEEWIEENEHRVGSVENGQRLDARWLQRECLARVYLTDWDGWTEGGEAVPFSHDKASEWCHDPRMEHWVVVTLRLADQITRFREKQEHEAGKP